MRGRDGARRAHTDTGQRGKGAAPGGVPARDCRCPVAPGGASLPAAAATLAPGADAARRGIRRLGAYRCAALGPCGDRLPPLNPGVRTAGGSRGPPCRLSAPRHALAAGRALLAPAPSCSNVCFCAYCIFRVKSEIGGEQDEIQLSL